MGTTPFIGASYAWARRADAKTVKTMMSTEITIPTLAAEVAAGYDPPLRAYA